MIALIDDRRWWAIYIQSNCASHGAYGFVSACAVPKLGRVRRVAQAVVWVACPWYFSVVAELRGRFSKMRKHVCLAKAKSAPSDSC